MDLIKKIAIGSVGAAITLSASIAPAFAATATNTNISGGSIAKSKAVEVNKQKARVRNENTLVVSVEASLSNTGLNQQSGNQDGNALTSKDAWSGGTNTTSVNYTYIAF